MLPLAWPTCGSALAAFDAHLGDLLDGHSAAGTGEGQGTKLPFGHRSALTLTLSPVLASDNSLTHPIPLPGSHRLLLLHPYSSPTSVDSIGTPSMHHCCDPASTEHTHGTGQTKTTCMALMDRQGALVAPTDGPGAHAWHCWVGTKHLHGIA